MESQALVDEVWTYLPDFVLNLIDPLVRDEGLMDVENILIEIALFEELEMRKDGGV